MTFTPELSDELYYTQQKVFPGQLYFPERFDIPLTREAFDTGNRRKIEHYLQPYWNAATKETYHKKNIRVTYDEPSRFDLALKPVVEKKLHTLTTIYTELYKNIQLLGHNDELDLEYYFYFHFKDGIIANRVQKFDTTDEWFDNLSLTIRCRLQYAVRYVNSAGARFEIYGYFYIPTKRSNRKAAQ